MTVREVLLVRFTQRLARVGWEIKACWGVGSLWPGVRRPELWVHLLPGLVRALVARSRLSLTLIGVVSGQERCVDGTTGQKSDERRWTWPEMASPEGEKEGGRRNWGKRR